MVVWSPNIKHGRLIIKTGDIPWNTLLVFRLSFQEVSYLISFQKCVFFRCICAFKKGCVTLGLAIGVESEVPFYLIRAIGINRITHHCRQSYHKNIAKKKHSERWYWYPQPRCQKYMGMVQKGWPNSVGLVHFEPEPYGEESKPLTVKTMYPILRIRNTWPW